MTPTHRIIHTFCGYPASIHDSNGWKKSDLVLHPERYFQGDEYVLADSAFGSWLIAIVPFKKPAALEPDNTLYCYIDSRKRVEVEHAIGELKGRFQSLRGMRVNLVTQGNYRALLDWVDACCVLHNWLLERNDRWEDPVEEEDRGEAEEQPMVEAGELEQGLAKRERIKEDVIGHQAGLAAGGDGD